MSRPPVLGTGDGTGGAAMRTFRMPILTAAAFLLFLAAPTCSSHPYPILLGTIDVGKEGKILRDYAILDPFALIVTDGALSVADLQTGTMLHEVPLAGSEGDRITTDGDLLYVTSSTQEEVLHRTTLEIFGLDDAGRPLPHGRLDMEGRGSKEIGIHEGAALLLFSDAIGIVDVRDPEHPVLATRVPWETGGGVPWNMAIGNDVAYVAVGAGGVAVLDLSDPFTPHPITRFELGWFDDLALHGPYLYLPNEAGLESEILVVEAGNPAQLLELDARWAWRPSAVTYGSGTLAVVVGQGKGIECFDLHDPTRLRYAGGARLPRGFDPIGGRMTIVGEHLYVGGLHGIAVFRIDAPF
ncbi:MAG: hypothetical protein D6812_03670 [Deltaproteobacteria bacterium]|nr:MAG: hypothetical protein D6812_03670 [Deltaproteobacteria bacterium]